MAYQVIKNIRVVGAMMIADKLPSVLTKFKLVSLLLIGISACNSDSDITNIVIGDSLGLTSTNIVLDPNGTAPLSAELSFTTIVAGTVTVTVEGKGPQGIPISHTFAEPATEFRLPVLGLYPEHINQVVVEFDAGAAGSARDVLEIATAALADAPDIEILVNALASDDSNVFMFADQQVAFDSQGEARWALRSDAHHIYRKRPNGLFLASVSEWPIRYHVPKFASYSVLGEKSDEYEIVDYIHHEVRELPWGNYLVAGNSSLIDFATNGVPEEDIVLEIDADSGTVVKTWDFNLILDPSRPTFPANSRPDDWLHINSVIYDENDNSIVITGRSQSAIVKVDYETAELRWILAAPEFWPVGLQDKLLTPVDSEGDLLDTTNIDFWPYGMHAALIREPGRVAVYDNGNYRGWYKDDTVSAESYSRAVEYLVDETSMTAEIIWEYNANKTLFTDSTGDIDELDENNLLIGFAGPSPDTPRVVELENDIVIFEAVSNRGSRAYRVEKFDLYEGL